jgi:aspartate beta-hydroxylase
MNARHPPQDDSEQNAQLLLRAGRVEEAERAYLKVLTRDPFDLQALNIVGLASIRLGQFHRARELLERAVSIRPDHAASHHHLGRALELLGDLNGSAEHHRRAAQLDAELPAARLHLAAVLERMGNQHESLVQYCRVLGAMQSQGKWVDRSTTPPALVPLVEHAVRSVRTGRRSMYERLLAPLDAKFGAGEMRRVHHMLRAYLGEEPAPYADPRQRPTFLYFPGLPTAPYFDRAVFPWLADFEAQTPAISSELAALLPRPEVAERVFSTKALEDQNLRGTRPSPPSWTGHYFYRSGMRRDENCAACPATTTALDNLPLCYVARHGPEVLFSVFTPGTHLLPHKGVTNTRVVGHLPLIVPADCALKVGGEEHTWQKGRVVVFDDTYDHEAWNRSDTIRVVLIFDMWNPYLTEVERLATAQLVEATGEFREAMEAG